MEDEEYKEPLSPSYRNMNGYLNTGQEQYDFELESQRSYDSRFNLMTGTNVNDIPRSNDGTYFEARTSEFGSEKPPLHSGYSTPSSDDLMDQENLFTVERVDDSQTHRWFKKPSRALSLLKMIIAFFLGILTLFCVVASKLSILSITSRLNNGTNSTGHKVVTCNDGETCERETAYVMLCIILMIPPLFTFMKMLILTCRKITHPWPTKVAILWVWLI